MKVIYYNHSGFSVETENKVLVFDYYSQDGRFDFLNQMIIWENKLYFLCLTATMIIWIHAFLG